MKTITKHVIKRKYTDQNDGTEIRTKTTLDHSYIPELKSAFLFIDVEHREDGSRYIHEQVSLQLNTKKHADQLIKALKKIKKGLK